MLSANYDMSCKAGTTFRKVFTFKDADENLLDLSGYTGRMQLRAGYAESSPALELTTENGRITIDGADVSLFISDEDTSALSPEFAKVTYVYDLELVASNGDVVSPIYGKFIITPEVTR